MPTTSSGGRDDLTRAECLALLHTQSVGRVVLTLDALPVVLPVGYRVEDDGIVLRTHTDSRIVAAAANAIVAFQVDALDLVSGQGWSVTVTGTARPVEPTRERLEGLVDLHHPAEAGTDFLMAIRPTVVSGHMLLTFPSQTRLSATG